MIRTVLRTGWLNLRRDPVALLLTFVVPVVLFSVFAIVFGSMDDQSSRPVRTILVCEDDSEAARDLITRLGALSTLRVVETDAPGDRVAAEQEIRQGSISVAVVVPRGFGAALGDPEITPRVELLTDTANPVALEVVRGGVQAEMLPLWLASTTPASAPPSESSESSESSEAPREPLALEVVDVLGQPGKRPSIAFFAAGIGVMFLLFAVTGRSAILIEERESGVLVRMLTSRLGLGRLLAGRWIYLLLLGMVQVTAMFVWGAFVFGLDLFTPTHLAGFAVMTLATASAAAAFALMLAVLCKTRAQLNGVAVVLVLIMSALGGSMFPRFLMPEALQELGRLTFNAWALDGYRKVFWYEASPGELGLEVAVLGALAVAFFACAGLFARRWRRA